MTATALSDPTIFDFVPIFNLNTVLAVQCGPAVYAALGIPKWWAFTTPDSAEGHALVSHLLNRTSSTRLHLPRKSTLPLPPVYDALLASTNGELPVLRISRPDIEKWLKERMITLLEERPSWSALSTPFPKRDNRTHLRITC
ncbi:hypothetical protein EDB84DRAFT_1580310 [Lactarius hengduanensis]|nr:hypothetical protein EDB84DRAFT_1580310 [Lactarius hengduanensis]